MLILQKNILKFKYIKHIKGNQIIKHGTQVMLNGQLSARMHFKCIRTSAYLVTNLECLALVRMDSFHTSYINTFFNR